jgi:membrane protein
VPPGTEDLVQYAFTARGSRPVELIVLATILSIWAASDVITSLMAGFQAAYRMPNTRGFWRQRWVAILLVFSALVPAIAASTLLVFSSNIEAIVLRWGGLLAREEQLKGIAAFFSRSASFALAFATLTIATSWLYRFAPSLPKRWTRVWPGAFVATCLWSVATLGFGWYVRNIATYNIMYGSIGAAIALLVWLYLMSAIALFGCVFNAEAERLRASIPLR